MALAPLRVTWAAALVLVVTGVAYSIYASQTNATLQVSVTDQMRGRILAIYGYAFFGLAPVGGLLAGWLAQTGGTQLAFLVAGVCGVGAAAYGWADRRPREAGGDTADQSDGVAGVPSGHP